MLISRLSIQNFRNLSPITLQLSPHMNAFYGANGSGKSSILEAIYYLGRGKSFRTHIADRLVQDNTQEFVLFAELTDTADSSGTPAKIGLSRHLRKPLQIKINAEPAKSIAELASYLPLQFINHDSYQLITEGPKVRRQYLDWGLFHVEPKFFSLWKQAEKILKQRNSLLKTTCSQALLQPWSEQYAAVSQQLAELRQAYFAELLPYCEQTMQQLLNFSDIRINYYRGWHHQKDLLQLLTHNIGKEAQLGYTLYGAHRADIKIEYQQRPAQDFLSRGQQKLLVTALALAQGQLFQQKTQQRCLYLIDDLPAELDSEKQQLLADYLATIKAQVFVTGVSLHDVANLVEGKQNKMFHVKHGTIQLNHT
jgi:DNA replication and repair protein RecF